MSEERPHSKATQVACTVPLDAWHCNASHGEVGAEESTHRSRGGWRHPASLAVVITAAASLITALTGVAALLLAARG
ncbi:hypothetical protein GCM10011428_13160 [Streptomyces violaceus]